MIHVIATLTIDPAKKARFVKIFTDLTPEVLAEDGCIEYSLADDQPTSMDVQELVGEEAVVVIEKWESVAHLEAHLAAPHMDKFREDASDILRGLNLLVLKPA